MPTIPWKSTSVAVVLMAATISSVTPGTPARTVVMLAGGGLLAGLGWISNRGGVRRVFQGAQFPNPREMRFGAEGDEGEEEKPEGWWKEIALIALVLLVLGATQAFGVYFRTVPAMFKAVVRIAGFIAPVVLVLLDRLWELNELRTTGSMATVLGTSLTVGEVAIAMTTEWP